MSNDDHKPFWWSLVEAAGINTDLWEPVKNQERTKPGELILYSQGWVETTEYNSNYRYSRQHPPRIRRKKVKMVTWRLCVCLEHLSDKASYARLEWIQSHRIEQPWCALESQTEPFETVKQLPEGDEL